MASLVAEQIKRENLKLFSTKASLVTKLIGKVEATNERVENGNALICNSCCY